MPAYRYRTLSAVLAATSLMLSAPSVAEPLFWSTQANPIEETQAMREQVLSRFEGGVDYQSSEGGPWLTRLRRRFRHDRPARGTPWRSGRPRG